ERVADTVTVAVGRDLIVGTGGARSGAGFLGIAVTGRGTADERARLEAVRRALADRPVAGLRDVAVARRRAALESGRQDDVGGTGRARPGAALGQVAVSRGGPALHGARLEGVVGAGRARARADFRDVAVARGGAALDGGGQDSVRRAVVADPAAALRHVAVPGRRPADARALHVGRACHVRPRAGLGHVTRPRRGAALDGGRLDRVRRAARVAAGAELGDVAVAGRRA